MPNGMVQRARSSWERMMGGFTKPYREAAPRTAIAPAVTPVTRTIAPTGGMNAGALAAVQRAKAYYAPGGGFGKGVEAGLERGRVKTMASGMQGLVSAGLAGTTMAAGLGKRYEEEVAAPTRLSVEEQRAQAISGIEMAGAGMQFQAGQAGAQRSLQMYIAELQANLQREQMARRDQPMATAPTGGGYAQQFPSLYDRGNQGGVEPYPGLGGGGGGISGLMQPGARQYDLPRDEERFDISW